MRIIDPVTRAAGKPFSEVLTSGGTAIRARGRPSARSGEDQTTSITSARPTSRRPGCAEIRRARGRSHPPPAAGARRPWRYDRPDHGARQARHPADDQHHDHQERDVEEERVGVERADEHAEERARDARRRSAEMTSATVRSPATPIPIARAADSSSRERAQTEADPRALKCPRRPPSRPRPGERDPDRRRGRDPGHAGGSVRQPLQFRETTFTMVSTPNVASPRSGRTGARAEPTGAARRRRRALPRRSSPEAARGARGRGSRAAPGRTNASSRAGSPRIAPGTRRSP